MNFDPIIPSILNVKASENLDINKDLEAPEKSIAELINDEKKEESQTISQKE